MKTLREQALPYLSLLYCGVCEPECAYDAPFEATERHLQALWFNSPFRPEVLETHTGERIRVMDPGRWNPDAGPDFLNAEFIIEPGGSRVRGDVEVHVHPVDWDRHGHAGDPRYGGVALHVVWFDAPKAHAPPPGAFTVVLKEAISKQPGFSFDRIDAAQCAREAVPLGGRPCCEHFSVEPQRVRSLLKAAGYYRLWQKTRRVVQHATASGDDCSQVFYESLMGVMGYRPNAAPFRRLASAIPLARMAGATPAQALAALAVGGGLLPDPARVNDAVRGASAKILWDLAWHMGVMPPEKPLGWSLGATRPANHPLRRLGAVAALVTEPTRFIERAPTGKIASADALRALTDALMAAARWPESEAGCCVWPSAGASAHADLIGQSRAQSVVTNALVPLLLARDALNPDFLSALPPEEVSAPMKETACRLLGSVRGAKDALASGLLQQGLLQVFADFCQNGRNACSRCPVPSF